MPKVTRTLLLINLAVYVLDLLLEQGGVNLSALCGLWYAGLPTFRLWQPLTYMFMHAGFMHLFFNMFALWMFGRIIEQLWGPQRFLIYYLVCGVGAGAVQELCQLAGWINPYAMTVGASGAVYGVLLAFGMCLPNERIFIIPIPFPIKAKYFVLFYALIELFEGMAASDGVAHFAHLGGMLFGFLLIRHWRRETQRQRRDPYAGWRTSSSADSPWSGGWSSPWSSGGQRQQQRRSSYGDAYDRYDRGSGDDSLWAKLKSLFGGDKKKERSKRPHIHVQEGGAQQTAKPRPRQENQEIDRILEKIRKGGYACLTDEEKARLFNASQK